VHAVYHKRHKLGLVATASKYPLAIAGRTLVAKTCNRCGLLLDATWFAKARGNGRGNSTCLACFNQFYRRYDPAQRKQRYADEGSNAAVRLRVMQAITLPTATRHREEWTDHDMRILENPDLTRLEKAIKVRRTYFAVSTKLGKLQLPSKAGKGDPLLAQWIIDNPNHPADPGSDQDRIVEAWRRINQTAASEAA
jgi:hypothetical protein